jgi:hypothetical protein
LFLFPKYGRGLIFTIKIIKNGDRQRQGCGSGSRKAKVVDPDPGRQKLPTNIEKELRIFMF